MASLRNELITKLQSMPEDSSFNQMIYELAVVEGIRKGLSDVEAGRVVPNEEVKARLQRLQVSGIPITEPLE